MGITQGQLEIPKDLMKKCELYKQEPTISILRKNIQHNFQNVIRSSSLDKNTIDATYQIRADLEHLKRLLSPEFSESKWTVMYSWHIPAITFTQNMRNPLENLLSISSQYVSNIANNVENVPLKSFAVKNSKDAITITATRIASLGEACGIYDNFGIYMRFNLSKGEDAKDVFLSVSETQRFNEKENGILTKNGGIPNMLAGQWTGSSARMKSFELWTLSKNLDFEIESIDRGYFGYCRVKKYFKIVDANSLTIEDENFQTDKDFEADLKLSIVPIRVDLVPDILNGRGCQAALNNRNLEILKGSYQQTKIIKIDSDLEFTDSSGIKFKKEIRPFFPEKLTKSKILLPGNPFPRQTETITIEEKSDPVDCERIEPVYLSYAAYEEDNPEFSIVHSCKSGTFSIRSIKPQLGILNMGQLFDLQSIEKSLVGFFEYKDTTVLGASPEENINERNCYVVIFETPEGRGVVRIISSIGNVSEFTYEVLKFVYFDDMKEGRMEVGAIQAESVPKLPFCKFVGKELCDYRETKEYP